MCGDPTKEPSTCDWDESESCWSCPQDCGPCEWVQVHSESSGLSQVLEGIWSNAPDRVFAVGWNGTILHYDGTSWKGMVSGTAEDLDAVWGSAPDNVFAVGWGGTILHDDGMSWKAMVSGTMEGLTAVWGSVTGCSAGQQQPRDLGLVGLLATL